MQAPSRSPKTIKKNVEAFNHDVDRNGGYVYTRNGLYSSEVANRRLTEATVSAITGLQQQVPVNSILDVGCGDGTYTAELGKSFPGLKVIGFDPAENAVRSAKQNFPDLEFFAGNILIPESIRAGHWDVAVLRGVLHHLPSPEQALKNCLALARALVIIEPNGWNPILKVIEKMSPYHVAHEEKSFSPNVLSRWCGEASFRVVSRSFVGFVPFLFPTLPAKLIHAVQPALEKAPLLPLLFSACSCLVCVRE